jgi:hypothetical protein
MRSLLDACRHRERVPSPAPRPCRCLPFPPQPVHASDPSSFPQTTNAPSRGALTTDFLAGDAAPLNYLEVWRGKSPGWQRE